MKVNEFLNEVLAAAKAAGIDPAEVYYHGGDSFNVSALDGEISDYKVASSCRVSLRGQYNGKMGSASTEAFDADAVRQLIDGVKESATLLETDEQDEIFAGEERYPTIEKEESDVATTSAEAKIEKCLKLEALAKAADPRIVRVLQQRSHPAQQLWAEFAGFGKLLRVVCQSGCQGWRLHGGQWQNRGVRAFCRY